MERGDVKDLREEVGTNAYIVGKSIKSRIKWAGNMVRMKDDRSSKRSERKKQEVAENEDDCSYGGKIFRRET